MQRLPTLPDDVKDILDRQVFVHVATVNPDGSPQSSVVWVEREGNLIRFSTADGRIKPRNLSGDVRVALSFTDPEDPYVSVSIHGRAISLEKNGTRLIDRLAYKYLGEKQYLVPPGQERIDVTIAPERVSCQL